MGSGKSYYVIACLIAIVLAQCVAPEAIGAPSGRRLALVIGNDHYQENGGLKSAIQDAVGMDQELKAAGFTTQLMTDVDAAALEFGVEQFIQRLQPGDVAAFYYAGHGMQINGENYLIPIDFTARTENEAKQSAYGLSRLIPRMNSRGTAVNILILDACRDNPFRFSRSLARGLAPLDTGKGTYVAFSTSPGSTAADGLGHGLFTKHLLSELSALKESHLGLDELFARVRAAVTAESAGTQVPWSASSITGNFKFREEASGTNSVTAGIDPTRDEALTRNLRSATAIVASSPNNAAAYVVRAASYLRAGDYGRAFEDLDRAVAIDPKCAEAYRLRGRARLATGNAEAAAKDLRLALSLAPADDTISYYLSLALILSTQYDDAAQIATEMIQKDPTVISAYLSRSTAYLARGRFADAIADCDRVIEVNPDVSVIYAIRGTALRALGHSDAAVQEFKRATHAIRSQTIPASNRAQ